MQPAHRAEALDELARIELKFALLRERLYVEKMDSLAWEEGLIADGALRCAVLARVLCVLKACDASSVGQGRIRSCCTCMQSCRAGSTRNCLQI